MLFSFSEKIDRYLKSSAYIAAISLLSMTPPVCEEAKIRTLSFDRAYQDLLERTFEIKAVQAAVKAKEGERWQAGLHINPEFNLELESIEGNNRDPENNELFVGMTQQFELGGKRQARVRVADAEVWGLTWDLEIAKAELFGALLHAFIDVAAAQERVKLIFEQQHILEEILECFKRKQEGGKVSLVLLKKAEVNLYTGKLKLARAEADLLNTNTRLRGLWDCHPPTYDAILFSLEELSPPGPLAPLSDNLVYNPQVARADAQVCRAEKMVQLERTGRFPDLAVQVGVTTYRFNEDPGLTVALNIPLPLFDRNQGNICRAMHEYNEAVYQRAELLCRLRTELALAHQSWLTAYQQADELRRTVLPLARESYQLAKLGHEEGKFACLDLLEAHTALFGLQEIYLDALKDYQHRRADLLTLQYPTNQF